MKQTSIHNLHFLCLRKCQLFSILKYKSNLPPHVHTKQYPTQFLLYSCLKSLQILLSLMIKSLKSLIRSRDLTSPAHLSPNDLIPYAPAKLTSSDFFSGMFSLLSQGQHMYPSSLLASALASLCYLSSLHLNVTHSTLSFL